jgi:predicted ATP-dependent endonuclease of OLD family
VHTDRHDRSIVRMGQGFRRLFIMLFYIFHPAYDIILIDEPEMHLHPSVLKRFLKILTDNRFNNQIFLTTHSSLFVQPSDIEHIWRVTRDKGRHTQIYSLACCGISFNKNRLVQELNADNTEMFFADKVLLVEGVSDRILMRSLIDKFYSGKHDIKVIFAGSKSNVDVYADLFRAFNIPYVVMLDRDALGGTWSELIKNRLKGHHQAPLSQKIKILKDKNIFILEGDLEQSYPRKYQIKDTKPLNALYAGSLITKADLESRKMRVIKRLIYNL